MSHRTPVAIRRTALVALLAGALTFAGAAVAKAPTTVVKAGTVSGKRIVVNAKGLTLYRLKPETTKRVLCTAGCLGPWPPLTVPSAKTKIVAGKGVKGKLTIFRSGGKFRVALRGYPLYTFTGDSSRGTAAGNGLQSFGGTWLVVSAK